MGPRMQPRNEKFFTLSARPLERRRECILTEFTATPHECWRSSPNVCATPVTRATTPHKYRRFLWRAVAEESD
jgi:hypothetical protein